MFLKGHLARSKKYLVKTRFTTYLINLHDPFTIGIKVNYIYNFLNSSKVYHRAVVYTYAITYACSLSNVPNVKKVSFFGAVPILGTERQQNYH